MRQRLEDAVASYSREAEGILNLHAGKSRPSGETLGLLASPLVYLDMPGTPEAWHHAGSGHLSDLYRLTVEAAEHLFGTSHVELRAPSGSVANGFYLMSQLRPGDAIAVPPAWAFGHKSYLDQGYPGKCGAKTHEIPWDPETLTPDLEKLPAFLEKHRPKIVVLGTYITLFQDPLAEVADAARGVEARAMYDAAHLLGLIATDAFPNPLTHGFEVVTGSTQKTLGGPMGGLVLLASQDEFEMLTGNVDALLAGYGNARIAALGIRLCELVDHGSAYGHDVVSNAQHLARDLAEQGFNVIGREQGFTETHQVVVDVTEFAPDAKSVHHRLAEAGIVASCYRVDERLAKPHGGDLWLRFGSTVLTRLGMGRAEIDRIAALLGRLFRSQEPPQEIKPRIQELLRDVTGV